VPIDEVITQLEQAVLQAATKATEGAIQDDAPEAKQWAEATQILAESLAVVRGAYYSM